MGQVGQHPFVSVRWVGGQGRWAASSVLTTVYRYSYPSGTTPAYVGMRTWRSTF